MSAYILLPVRTEYFSPNWISDERLRAIGDGSNSIKEALDALAATRESRG
jgi:hypothetical protein